MSDTISLDETIKLIMSRRGVSRRQAKRMLMKKLATGQLRATGMVVVTTPTGECLAGGTRESVPPEFWQGPWIDTEGDKGTNK